MGKDNKYLVPGNKTGWKKKRASIFVFPRPIRCGGII